MNNFLPQDFKVEKKPSDYLKLEDGDITLFRVLSPSINGHQGWKNKKPVTKPHGAQWRTDEVDKMDDTKQFIACIIYNYELKRIQIWFCTQKGMLKKLLMYARSKNYGDPKEYDLEISRVGSTMVDTEYTLVAKDKTPISKEILELYKKTPVNLNALFSGKDPFKDFEDTFSIFNNDDLIENEDYDPNALKANMARAEWVKDKEEEDFVNF